MNTVMSPGEAKHFLVPLMVSHRVVWYSRAYSIFIFCIRHHQRLCGSLSPLQNNHWRMKSSVLRQCSDTTSCVQHSQHKNFMMTSLGHCKGPGNSTKEHQEPLYVLLSLQSFSNQAVNFTKKSAWITAFRHPTTCKLYSTCAHDSTDRWIALTFHTPFFGDQPP